MNALSRHGVKKIGLWVTIRSFGSNSTSKDPKPNWYSITPASPKERQGILRPDGGLTIGSRSRSSWDETLGPRTSRSISRKSILYPIWEDEFSCALSGFDPDYPTCYKRLFCIGR